MYGLQSDYPDRVRVRRYGKSYQNRDLLEVKAIRTLSLRICACNDQELLNSLMLLSYEYNKTLEDVS